MYNPQEKKLDPRTLSGYFIGYSERYKGYKFDCPSLPIRIAKTKSTRFFEDEKLSGPRDIVFEKLPEPGEPSPPHLTNNTSGLTFPYPVEQPSAVETPPVVQGQGKSQAGTFSSR